MGPGLVNSQTAEVTSVKGDRVTFRIEAVTGERIAALEVLGSSGVSSREAEKPKEALQSGEGRPP